MTDYKYIARLDEDILTVTITLPKLKTGQLSYKIDSATILNDLKSKYGIIGCVQKKTLSASADEEREGDIVFRVTIPTPSLTVKRPKNTIKSLPKKEESE